MNIARALLVSTLLLAGCDSLGITGSITGIVSREPLPVYAEWWAATEACSARVGEFSSIDWFEAESITQNGAIAFGAWRPPHEIVIVRGFEENEVTVRHEMLHDLLRGDSEHQSALWRSCGLISGS